MRFFLFIFQTPRFLTISSLSGLLSLLVSSASIEAQETQKPSTYTEAAQKSRLAKIEEILQIHYLNESYKSPYDRVEIQGDQVKVSVWRDLPTQPSPENVECVGYRWLLSGRGDRMGFGASRVFEEFPEIASIELSLYELNFDVKSKDGRGQLEREIEAKRFLRYKILRSDAQILKNKDERLKEELRDSTERCLTIGRRLKMEREISL